MIKKMRHKLLALAMTAAMITTLFAGLTISASAETEASGSWANYAETTWYTSNTSASTYNIDTAAKLAGLASLVNAGTTDFAGKTIYLTTDINLSAHYWIPIGGHSSMSGGVPTGNSFKGTFDGYRAGNAATYNTCKITGLNVNAFTTGYGGYGLFGYVDGGTIQNLTIAPATGDTGISTAANVSAVGGFVGYTNGTLYNLHNDGVTVLVNNTSASQTGGVAGTVENTTSTAMKVQYCSNTGAITGRGRVGGIVGAVYCTYAGGVVVDNCFNRGNTLTTVGTTLKSYTGGIAGYCRGYITNCYSYNAVLHTEGGHYLAGIAGLLQGSGPMAALSNSYTYATFGTATHPVDNERDHFAFATVDNSSTLPIANTLWVNNNPQPGNITLTQPFESGWGSWSKVGTFSGTSSSSVYTSGSSTPSTYAALDVLNGTSTIVSSSNAISKPDAYESVSGGQTGGYPSLKWETNPNFTQNPGSGSSVNSDDSSMIFLDGTASSNGNGTQASPYNNLTSAVNALSSTRNVIYVLGTVTLSSDTSITSSVANATIKRSCTLSSAPLITVTGGTTTVSNMIIDGNRANVGSNKSLITVTGGTLALNSGSYLQNNLSYRGGGVDVSSSGNLSISGGVIQNNVANCIWVPTTTKYTADGGGVAFAGTGTFTMTSGSISNNLAVSNYSTGAQALGGGVYYNGANSFNFSGGTISNNAVGPNNTNLSIRGGGIYQAKGTITMSGTATITGNSALQGAGLYKKSGNSAVFNYAGSGIATDQIIYLENTSGNSDAYIKLTAAPSNTITVQCANPVSNNTVVAIANTNAVGSFAYVNSSYSFDSEYVSGEGYEIWIV